MIETQVLIVGAGPIGLEVAWHLREAGLDTTQVDSGPIGATIAALFPPHTRFFSSPERLAIAGIAVPTTHQEKPTGKEYLSYLRTVALSRDLPVLTYHTVVRVAKVETGYIVTMINRAGCESQLLATHIVLATGGTDRPRRLNIPGEDLPHVRSHLGDPHQYFRRRVLIVGGKNSAAESALRCWRVNADVHISYRGKELHERVKYWIRPELASLIDEGRVSSWMPSTITRITPDHVCLHKTTTDERITLPVDDVLLQIGYEQDDAIFRLFGVDTIGEEKSPVHSPETLETNIPNIYVAGTAAAGTQKKFRAYIETAHDHGPRIAAALTGAPPPAPMEARVLPES